MDFRYATCVLRLENKVAVAIRTLTALLHADYLQCPTIPAEDYLLHVVLRPLWVAFKEIVEVASERGEGVAKSADTRRQQLQIGLERVGNQGYRSQASIVTAHVSVVLKWKQVIAKAFLIQFAHFPRSGFSDALGRKDTVFHEASFADITLEQRNVRSPEFPVGPQLVSGPLGLTHFQRMSCSIRREKADFHLPGLIEPVLR